MESILDLDKQLLLFFNGHQSSFGDYFFTQFSGKMIWIPLAAFILLNIIYTKRKDSFWILLFLLLALVCSDQISHILKHWIARPRPTHEPSLEGLVRPVFGYLGGRYGFVSSHAANSFAFALFTSFLYSHRLYSFLIFSWAVANSYSRMYLGVHYPCDILCGALLGLFIGYVCYLILSRIKPGIFQLVKEPHYTRTGFSYLSVYGVVFCMLLTVFAMLAGSFCFLS